MRSILTFLIVVTLTSSASAAPIQGLIDAQTGAVSFRGLTGEIYIGVQAPEAWLRRANQLQQDVRTMVYVDPEPNRISVLGLGGIINGVNFGNVIAPGLTASQLAEVRMIYQTNFVSDLIEIPPSFVASSANIPAGQAGLFVIIPEPAAAILATSAIAGLVLLRRRRHDHRAGRAHQ